MQITKIKNKQTGEVYDIGGNNKLKLITEAYYDVESTSFIINYDILDNNKMYLLCFENDRGMSSMAFTIGRNIYTTPAQWVDVDDTVYSVYVVMGTEPSINEMYVHLSSDEEGVQELLDFNEYCKLTVYELPFSL